MLRLSIPKLACGGGVKGITRAIQSVDALATVEADLERREVAVTTSASKDRLLTALRQAGYPAELALAHVG
jgi:copper chaperone